jgi:hypothetical protein
VCLRIAFIEIKVIFIENNNIVPISHVIWVIYYNKIKGLDKIVYRDELFSNSQTYLAPLDPDDDTNENEDKMITSLIGRYKRRPKKTTENVCGGMKAGAGHAVP